MQCQTNHKIFILAEQLLLPVGIYISSKMFNDMIILLWHCYGLDLKLVHKCVGVFFLCYHTHYNSSYGLCNDANVHSNNNNIDMWFHICQIYRKPIYRGYIFSLYFHHPVNVMPEGIIKGQDWLT